MTKPAFAIVGCGKVGLNLARFLTECGYPAAGMASRSADSAQKAGELAGIDTVSTNAPDITKNADIVFITTPDGIIESTCNDIAENQGFRQGSIVLHCSGSLPSTILDSAKNAGAATGSIHPLQSFATTDGETNPFSGIIMAVEGEDPAVKICLEIAEALNARGFQIETDSKTMYHASAVVASNFMVTLAEFAYDLLAASGIDKSDAYAVLGPLIEGTLKNIKNVGPVEALTGPIVRGDVETVKTHLAEIDRKRPDLSNLYRILGKHTISIAQKRGTLTQDSEVGLQSLLGK